MRGKLAAEVESYVIVTTNMQVIHENHHATCFSCQKNMKAMGPSIAQQQLDAPVWVGK